MTQICSTADCGGLVGAKGMCRPCYKRYWRTGSPIPTARSFRHGTLEEHFWSHVSKGGLEACWEWQAFRDKDGYGKLRVGKTNRAAHIVSWFIHFGVWPDLCVLHRCNNPACVNPKHLRLGDHNENMKDRIAAGHYAAGERATAAKFSDSVVEAVRSDSGTYAQIGERFGMSPSQVGNIKRGAQRRKRILWHGVEIPA